jgi:hypothetical protein
MQCRFLILAVLSAALTMQSYAADDDKTEYAGQICDQAEFARVVTAKKRTLEIQGGFSTKQSRESYGKAGWDQTGSFNVGDTIDMEFHIGVKEVPFKLSTKSFPSPEPVLFLMKDGAEFQQVKFTKGAC